MKLSMPNFDLNNMPRRIIVPSVPIIQTMVSFAANFFINPAFHTINIYNSAVLMLIIRMALQNATFEP